MLRFKEGDIYSEDTDVIICVVGVGEMSSPYSAEVMSIYPEVESHYRRICSKFNERKEELMGCLIMSPLNGSPLEPKKYIALCVAECGLGAIDAKSLMLSMISLAEYSKDFGLSVSVLKALGYSQMSSREEELYMGIVDRAFKGCVDINVLTPSSHINI